MRSSASDGGTVQAGRSSLGGRRSKRIVGVPLSLSPAPSEAVPLEGVDVSAELVSARPVPGPDARTGGSAAPDDGADVAGKIGVGSSLRHPNTSAAIAITWVLRHISPNPTRGSASTRAARERPWNIG